MCECMMKREKTYRFHQKNIPLSAPGDQIHEVNFWSWLFINQESQTGTLYTHSIFLDIEIDTNQHFYPSNHIIDKTLSTPFLIVT